jgi:hypothetical protein
LIATDSIEPRWNKRGGKNAKKASEFNESKKQMKWKSIFERDVKRLKTITERKERQIYKQKQKIQTEGVGRLGCCMQNQFEFQNGAKLYLSQLGAIHSMPIMQL